MRKIIKRNSFRVHLGTIGASLIVATLAWILVMRFPIMTVHNQTNWYLFFGAPLVSPTLILVSIKYLFQIDISIRIILLYTVLIPLIMIGIFAAYLKFFYNIG